MKKTKKDSYNIPIKKAGKVVGFASGKKNAKNVQKLLDKKKK